MRHQVTKVTKRKDGGTYKVSFWIPLEYEGIDQVEFHVWKFSEHRIFEMQFIQNEEGHALFETVLYLEDCPLYHYYFSFYSEGHLLYHERKHFTKTSII